MQKVVCKIDQDPTDVLTLVFAFGATFCKQPFRKRLNQKLENRLRSYGRPHVSIRVWLAFGSTFCKQPFRKRLNQKLENRLRSYGRPHVSIRVWLAFGSTFCKRLGFEETVQSKIYKLKLFDMNISELITGVLSTITAIFISSKVRISIAEENYLLEHPLLDVSGLLIGTLVVIANYLFYMRVIRCLLFTKFCKK